HNLKPSSQTAAEQGTDTIEEGGECRHNREHVTKIKVCLIGGESVFKTTVASRLAQHLNTTFVEEYAREYFQARDLDTKPFCNDDFIQVARGQLELEKKYMDDPRTGSVLICDTCPLMTLLWSDTLIGSHDESLDTFISQSYYDLYILLDCHGVEWVDDKQLRVIPEEKERSLFQTRLIEHLSRRSISYTHIHGDLNTRFTQSLEAIRRHME
ncbi:hypothetical protein SAMD00019534_106630, partial [Acytostelium subglobosum LB1]|uniref:hypothetical protein n=1 Tax=Acytostelium subglobosum LB1 TaxID=1410327 RepID=UPI000645008C